MSGTLGFDLSRDYVAWKLRAAGYQVTVQPFEFLFEGYRTPPVLQRTDPDPKTYTYGFFSDYVAMSDSPAGSVSGQTQAVDLVLPPGAPNSSTSGVYDGDGDAFGTAGPEGSAQIEEDFEKFYGGRGLPFTATAFTGRSDYGAFIAAGIPAGGLFTGAEVLKTEEEAAIGAGTPSPAGAARTTAPHQHGPALSFS